MVEQLSSLGQAFRPGSHGNFANGVGVTLSEIAPGSIVQAAAWPGSEKKMMAAIASVTGLKLADGAGAGAVSERHAAFGFAPGKFLVTDVSEGLAAALAGRVGPAIGTLTDLSHGRTAIRIITGLASLDARKAIRLAAFGLTLNWVSLMASRCGLRPVSSMGHANASSPRSRARTRSRCRI